MSWSKSLAKAPIHAYRWTLKPLMGLECRHLPTCSEYALDAVETNGAWRGFWLTIARLSRCHPWGSAGYDPAPDIRDEHHTFAPWLYGRWCRCGGGRGGARDEGRGGARDEGRGGARDEGHGEAPGGGQNFTSKS